MNSPTLMDILSRECSQITLENRLKIEAFFNLLVAENKIQNLTRLSSPENFYFGHLRDVLELEMSGWLENPPLDLGSGGGVPGLLSNCLHRRPWILVESEKKKAEFLKQAAERLSFDQVRVINDRLEACIFRLEVGSVVVRAVGKVEKIYGWLSKCSTWNNLILFKGPGWDAEWDEFQSNKRLSKGLQLVEKRQYSVGPEEKSRTLIKLARRLVSTQK